MRELVVGYLLKTTCHEQDAVEHLVDVENRLDLATPTTGPQVATIKTRPILLRLSACQAGHARILDTLLQEHRGPPRFGHRLERESVH